MYCKIPVRRRTSKLCFKLSETVERNTFPGWNQLSDSLEWCIPADRRVEYLEIYEFHQNHWKDFSDKQNINFLNLYPYFEGSNKEETIIKNFILNDVHWNSRGTSIVYDAINKKIYKFTKEAKDNNELYGSIKPSELSKTMEDNHKVEIQPSQIDIGKEINKIGTYEAKINLHAEIQAKIHIEVVKKEEKN